MNAGMERDPIQINPVRVALGLSGITLFLLLVSVLGQVLKYKFHGMIALRWITLMDVSREMNIPTFFSAGLLLIAMALLALMARLESRSGSGDASKWRALSLVFLYMTYDEAFQVHEAWVGPMRIFLGCSHLGVLYYAWVVPGTLLVLLVALGFLRFLFRLPRKTRLRFILAATLFLGGCFGFEMVGGVYDEWHGHRNLTYNLISTCEEALEMIGMIVFIHALTAHLAATYGRIGIRFGVEPKAAAEGRPPADRLHGACE